MKADIVLLSALETICMRHHFERSTVFSCFLFSAKDSRIPFSFGHYHSQYIYYNNYLSINRNCLLTIDKTNSPNFSNHLPLPNILLFTYDYRILK